MSKPLISVIIPAYNIELYIERCLDSIINQSYENLEIIVVDDGSTDNTGIILDTYKEKDNRIKVIHKNNTGVSDTRNTGIDIAVGDYIGFVDGDDTIHPDMYKILVENALKYDADISHCGYQMVFPNRRDDYYGTNKILIQDNQQGVYDLLDATMVEPGLCNKLYKKDMIGSLRLNKNIRINEDLLFNYYAFKKSTKSIFEDKMLYYYMVRPASASTQKLNKNKILDPMKVLVEIKEQEIGTIKELAEKRLLYVLEKFFSTPRDVLYEYISKEEYNQRRELMKNLLNNAENNTYISKIDLWKAKLANVCPMVYRFVYKIYDLKAKSSKKYEV